MFYDTIYSIGRYGLFFGRSPLAKVRCFTPGLLDRRSTGARKINALGNHFERWSIFNSALCSRFVQFMRKAKKSLLRLFLGRGERESFDDYVKVARPGLPSAQESRF